jgi:lysophospholipase L1-like esterase
LICTQTHITLEQTSANIQAMANLAQQNHVRVILCTLPPVSHYPEPQQAIFDKEIRALNNWILAYATRQNLTYVNYYSAMADDSGAMKSSLTNDGLHPNAAGYNVMRPLAQRAIDGHP